MFRFLKSFQIFEKFSDIWKVFRFFESCQIFWKLLWPETWHLRHWLHFWQLRTTIWTITMWPLNRERWWQHSQFLRCFISVFELEFAFAFFSEKYLPAVWRMFYRIEWFVYEPTRSQKSSCLPASNFPRELSQKLRPKNPRNTFQLFRAIQIWSLPQNAKACYNKWKNK